MGLRAGMCVALFFGALGCSNTARVFSTAGGASGASGNDTGGMGHGANGGAAPSAGGRGATQEGGTTNGDSGAAGMAGETIELPDLCVGKVCDSPPADDCLSGMQFQTYDKVGTCNEGTCSYVPHSIACSCTAHACTTDPCIGIVCTTPPSPICKDANTVTNYAASGTCAGGSCSYTPTNSGCPFGCANGACKADPCGSLTCVTPPPSTCKDTGTRTTYAASGTCSSGACSYAPANSACSGDTPKCKDSGGGSQCVACLTNTDCNNGGTCSAGACVCSARFNGKHCEFQVFRALGALSGDSSSTADRISPDGRIVLGSSEASFSSPLHAFRSVDGGALQYIPEPSTLTPQNGCHADAVNSAGEVLLTCEGFSQFLYTTAGGAVALDVPANSVVSDISANGSVLVGRTNTLGLRKAGSASLTLGPLEPGGSTDFSRTNADGSAVVGVDTSPSTIPVAVLWTTSAGLVTLSPLKVGDYSSARDVSADGKVIVGSSTDPNTGALTAIKWSVASPLPTSLGPGDTTCVNRDGTVIAGSDGKYSTAMIWNNSGAHVVRTLLSASPDLTPDWTLNSVQAISDDGKCIAGIGTHGTHTEGWVAHLP